MRTAFPTNHALVDLTPGLFDLPIARHDRRHIGARGGNVNVLYELIAGKRGRALSCPVPFSSSAWTGVIGGNHSGFRIRQITKRPIGRFEIPAANLHIPLRIAEHGTWITGHLPLQLAHAGLSSPLASHGGCYLHQSDLAVFPCLPGTEIGFFIDYAP